MWAQRRKFKSESDLDENVLLSKITRKSLKTQNIRKSQQHRKSNLENMFDVDDVLSTTSVTDSIDESNSIFFQNFQVLLKVRLKKRTTSDIARKHFANGDMKTRLICPLLTWLFALNNGRPEYLTTKSQYSDDSSIQMFAIPIPILSGLLNRIPQKTLRVE